MTTMKKFITGILIGSIALITAFTTIEVVPAGYVGVVYNLNGGITGETLSQGVSFVSPTKDVKKYPVSNEIYKWSSKANEGGETNDSIRVGSKDGKQITMDIQLSLCVKPEKAPDLYKTYRGRDFDTIVDLEVKPKVKEILNSLCKKEEVFEIYTSKTASISESATEILSKELEKMGIVLKDFSITDVNLDAETQTALDKVQAEKLKKAEAQAKAENTLIEAQANAKALETKSQAEANATLAKAEAQAKANKLLSESITPTLVDYERAKKWDGKQPTHVLGNNTSMLIPAN